MPAAQPRNSVQTSPLSALDVATERARLEDSRATEFSQFGGVYLRYEFWNYFCYTFDYCSIKDPADTLGDHFTYQIVRDSRVMGF